MNKKRNNFLGNIFDAISGVLNGAERALLDLISVIVPYCVPLPVAYLTFWHTVNMMDFPVWLGWTSAFTIEALGLASVSTAIRFYRNNKAYKSDKERAPFGLALGVYVFYIIVTITLNVVLEIVDGSRGGWIIFSIGLFTLLSVPSGVLISIRSLYTEMLEERDEKKQERAQAKRPRQAWTPQQLPGYASETERPELTEETPKSGGLFRRKNGRS